jgi:hypothetical protein
MKDEIFEGRDGKKEEKRMSKKWTVFFPLIICLFLLLPGFPCPRGKTCKLGPGVLLVLDKSDDANPRAVAKSTATRPARVAYTAARPVIIRPTAAV